MNCSVKKHFVGIEIIITKMQSSDPDDLVGEINLDIAKSRTSKFCRFFTIENSGRRVFLR